MGGAPGAVVPGTAAATLNGVGMAIRTMVVTAMSMATPMVVVGAIRTAAAGDIPVGEFPR